MQEQLDRIEQKVDSLTTIVHQQVGFIKATKALLSGAGVMIGAAWVAFLAWFGITRGN